MPIEIRPPRISSNDIAASQPITGEEVEAGRGEEADANADEKHVAHQLPPSGKEFGLKQQHDQRRPKDRAEQIQQDAGDRIQRGNCWPIEKCEVSRRQRLDRQPFPIGMNRIHCPRPPTY